VGRIGDVVVVVPLLGTGAWFEADDLEEFCGATDVLVVEAANSGKR